MAAPTIYGCGRACPRCCGCFCGTRRSSSTESCARQCSSGTTWSPAGTCTPCTSPQVGSDAAPSEARLCAFLMEQGGGERQKKLNVASLVVARFLVFIKAQGSLRFARSLSSCSPSCEAHCSKWCRKSRRSPGTPRRTFFRCSLRTLSRTQFPC